jgi:pimeloyl-ACP methyl ester carboxylesterase
MRSLASLATAVLCFGLLLAPSTKQVLARAVSPDGLSPAEGHIIVIPGIVPDCKWILGYQYAVLSQTIVDMFSEGCDTGNVQGAISRGQATFDLILNHLTVRIGPHYSPANIHFFNYSSDWQNTYNYYGPDTRQRIGDSAKYLNQQIHEWGTDKRYDIISHSLGGAIAAYWAAEESDSETIAAVHSIITLDSPVQGMPSDQISSLDRAGYLIKSGGAAGADLQDDGVRFGMQLAPQDIDIATFSNSLDDVVPSTVSNLDGACPPVVENGCQRTINPIVGGAHVAILQDLPMLDVIDSILAWPNAPSWLKRHAIPTGADPAPAPALKITADAVWHPSAAQTEQMYGCTSSACLRDLTQSSGAPTLAQAFAAIHNYEFYISEYHSYGGTVDLVRLQCMFVANYACGYMLVNGTPDAIRIHVEPDDPDVNEATLESFLLSRWFQSADNPYDQLLARQKFSPEEIVSIKEFESIGWAGEESYWSVENAFTTRSRSRSPSSRSPQEYVFAFPIKRGHVDTPDGFVLVKYRFDEAGAYLGKEIADVIKSGPG